MCYSFLRFDVGALGIDFILYFGYRCIHGGSSTQDLSGYHFQVVRQIPSPSDNSSVGERHVSFPLTSTLVPWSRFRPSALGSEGFGQG